MVAKGQLRSNKEAKKPKKDKGKSAPAGAAGSNGFSKQGPQAGSQSGKK
jgi:hypothetical protein